MKSNLKALLVAALCFSIAATFYVQVSEQPFCITLPHAPGSFQNLFYESISQQSTLYSQISGVHINSTRVQGPKIKLTLNSSQQITVCLGTAAKTESVSIDFYLDSESKYKQLVLKDEVNEIHRQFIQIGSKLKEIEHLYEFEEQRETVQSNIIQRHEATICMYSIIKVGLVALLILAQIYILQRKLSISKIRNYFDF